MTSILNRKLSGLLTSESIINIICKRNNKNNHKKIISDRKYKKPIKPIKSINTGICSEKPNKRQKKTHYNDKMEPIRLSESNNDAGNLPKRIREVVWNTYNGETYSCKCYISWCSNIINVFNYQVGHDIPESKGGTYDINNLKPICSNCNLSMGNKWTIQEWGKLININ